MNAILGYTELLLDETYGELPDKIRSVLDRVAKSGRHLLGLINDVLDLSKIEAGELALSLSDYSIKDVVQGVLLSVESLAAEKSLELQATLPPDLPLGRGDERRLTQVVLNLVGNAISSPTPAGRDRDRAQRDVQGLGQRHRRRDRAGDQARSSRSSSRWTTRARARSAAPGSGWPSRGASSRCTAGASGSSPSSARDQPSRSPSRSGSSAGCTACRWMSSGGPRHEPAIVIGEPAGQVMNRRVGS
jgi:hypothetical protein